MSQSLTHEVLAGINADSQVCIELMVKNTGKKLVKKMTLGEMCYTQPSIDADRKNGVLAKQLTDTIEAWVYEYIDADWAAAIDDEDIVSSTDDVTFSLYFGGMASVIEETKLAHEWLDINSEYYDSLNNISLLEEAFQDCVLEWRNSQFDFAWQLI